jgi:hypothetical protein
MFAIVNNAVFVVHGGLFHTKNVFLSELETIKRIDFTLQDLPEGFFIYLLSLDVY